MALQALGAYAERAYSPNFNLSLKVQNGPDSQHFSINPQNAIVLQSYEVILMARRHHFTASFFHRLAHSL